jgi:hypothetical protein
MVYAAFRMIDDDDAAGHNYFTRLRNVLGLTPAADNRDNRPEGMKIHPITYHAPEAPLWQQWISWLSEKGWIPTAALRQATRHHWSDYPISQTLLRDGDRQKIAATIDDERNHSRLPTVPDAERIAVFLRRSVARMPKHLQPLIRRENRMDLGRFEELTQQVLDLALAPETSSTGQTSKTSTFHASTRLMAGLFRFEDTVNRVLEYRLFPRQPLRYQGEPVFVNWNGHLQLLPYAIESRWFRSLGPVALHDPPSVEILDHPRLRQLVLPASTFWLFVREAGETGPWATWRRPELGERFLLLCRPAHDEHLKVLQQSKLLTWDSMRPVTIFCVEWREYFGCRIEASNWNEVNESAESAELFAALRPPSRASIHLVGGLPAPNGVGWMSGFPPHVWVCAFQDQVDLCLSSLVRPECETSWPLDANAPNQPLHLPDNLPAGPYLLSARLGSRLLAERVLELRSWDDLTALSPEEHHAVSLVSHRLCGALLEPLKP